MNIDKTTYKDRKERQIGMTANHTSRHADQNLPKSAILPTLQKEFFD